MATYSQGPGRSSDSSKTSSSSTTTTTATGAAYSQLLEGMDPGNRLGYALLARLPPPLTRAGWAAAVLAGRGALWAAELACTAAAAVSHDIAQASAVASAGGVAGQAVPVNLRGGIARSLSALLSPLGAAALAWVDAAAVGPLYRCTASPAGASPGEAAPWQPSPAQRRLYVLLHAGGWALPAPDARALAEALAPGAGARGAGGRDAAQPKADARCGGAGAGQRREVSALGGALAAVRDVLGGPRLGLGVWQVGFGDMPESSWPLPLLTS